MIQQTVQTTAVLPGGGATEMMMAQAVEEAAKKESGKEVLAMEAFATALRQMPMHIADNAGYDSAALIAGLKAKHFDGKHTWGLEMDAGGACHASQPAASQQHLSPLALAHPACLHPGLADTRRGRWWKVETPG